MLWVYIWLAVCCVSALIEAFTMQMVSIWFVAGGFVAVILAACNVALEIQVVVFVAVSVLALLCLRKLCMKFLQRKGHLKTNIDAFQGKETKLLKSISPDEVGEVRFADIVWTAIAENGDLVIEKGSLVRVLRVEGNKMIVAPVEKEKEKTTQETEAVESAEAPAEASESAKKVTKTTKSKKKD